MQDSTLGRRAARFRSRCGVGRRAQRTYGWPVGWGLSSVGQAQPDQGSAGGATGEHPAQARTAVVAGCAPGRFLIASGARARRDPNPTPTTPNPQPNGPGHSPREGPPEAPFTLTVIFPDRPPNAGSRQDPSHPPTPRVKDAEGGTPPTPEERSDVGPTHEPTATTSGQRNPDEDRVRSGAKHRDVGGPTANRQRASRAT